MADKDFAQIETSQFDSKDMAQPSNNKALWLSVLAISLSLLCFTAGFFLGEKHGLQTSENQDDSQFIATIKAQQKELLQLKEDEKKRQRQGITTSKVGELTFYNELPQQSIIPEPLHAPSNIKKSTATIPEINNENDNIQQVEKRIKDIIQQKLEHSARSFRIQVASFKLHKDALAFQPKLQDIGIQSTIHRVDLPNMGIWYRVFSTVFAKEEQAMHAKLAIKEKLHITGIMIQDD